MEIIEKFLTNRHGEKIFVETYNPERPKGTVLFLHGFTGCSRGRTMDDHYFQDYARELAALNYKVILFDYSGHGRSEGRDLDVCASKNIEEVELVFDAEVLDRNNFYLLGFSYGGAMAELLLERHPELSPRKNALISPCIFPNECCFLNKNYAFGRLLAEAFEERGESTAVFEPKNFHMSRKLIDDFVGFRPTALERFSDRILMLISDQDALLDESYNIEFCKQNRIQNQHFAASHALFECLDRALPAITQHFES